MTRPQKMDLAHTDNLRRWNSLIESAREWANDPMLTQYENDFIKSMLKHDKEDRPVWNPTVTQFNYFSQLIRSLS